MRLSSWPIRVLVQGACGFGLAALALMALSIVVPRALPILLAMSLAQVLGAGAFLCYLAAVLAEIKRHANLEQRNPPAKTE